ncbi:hypothetical protein GUITHDRAFT_132910 [Guillardia theta CCMP2712]|uniref:Uncharacterized protein n=2 Tax=Guillardia theta TaxID=55529 RepID=L1K0I9_GUITC|nr:hypothetical protein GUITHDRAFT_132910 [Guillardia theta CCMP2712]EKX53878.1 hypothetical protein GUITHDRAFT_132910 [Guillardia theta CCMP2712]|eukprot:XP_005840858.1 hypothetical protein GUITHDRAFT_132910 [Guillardia theta CCMP2712]
MWFVEKMQQSSKPSKQNKKKWVAVQAASFVLSLFFEIKRRAEETTDGVGEESSTPDMQEEATDIVRELLLSVQEDKSLDEFLLMLAKTRAAAETEWMVLKERIRKGPFLDSLNRLWNTIDEFEFGYPHRIEVNKKHVQELKELVARYKNELRGSVESVNHTLRMVLHSVKMNGIAVSGNIALPSPEHLFQAELLIFDEAKAGKWSKTANEDVQNFKKYFNRALTRLHELVINADHEMSYRTRTNLKKRLENIEKENQSLTEEIVQYKQEIKATYESQGAALEPHESSHRKRMDEVSQERERQQQQLDQVLASKRLELESKRTRLDQMKETLAGKKADLRTMKKRSKETSKDLDEVIAAAYERDETLVKCLSIITSQESLEDIKASMPSKQNIKNEIFKSVELLDSEVSSREAELKDASQLMYEQKMCCLRVFNDVSHQPQEAVRQEIERQQQNKLDMDEIGKLIDDYMHHTDFYSLDSSKLNAFVHLHLPFAASEAWRDFLMARYDEIFNDMQGKELYVSHDDEVKVLIASLTDYGYSTEETAQMSYQDLQKLLQEEQRISRME